MKEGFLTKLTKYTKVTKSPATTAQAIANDICKLL
jgi:hypothetical protein